MSAVRRIIERYFGDRCAFCLRRALPGDLLICAHHHRKYRPRA